MTEATTPDRVTAVQTYTRPATIRRAKALLARITPYRDWIRYQPRSAEACAGYRQILKALAAIIAGHSPDEITIIVNHSKKPKI
jgi:hypothetical protein